MPVVSQLTMISFKSKCPISYHQLARGNSMNWSFITAMAAISLSQQLQATIAQENSLYCAMTMLLDCGEEILLKYLCTNLMSNIAKHLV
jgi:hypothetical protein